MSSDRHGMELAINNLVVMILGILIVGAGMVLLAKIVLFSDSVVTQISTAQQQDLDKRLTAGQLVATTPDTLDLSAGETGIIGVGMQNILTKGNFAVLILPGTEGARAVIDSQDTTGTAWKVMSLGAQSIDQQARATFEIAITPGDKVAAGTYTFLVKVTRDDVAYGETRFFTVHVQ